MVTDLAATSIRDAADLLAHGELTSVELTTKVLERIEETEPQVHAFARVLREPALNAARRADEQRRETGGHHPLLGIPMAVKDMLFTEDAPTEAGSRVLEGYLSGSDATAVSRLRKAGAVIVGKTVTHEFAYGFNVPPTRNPWRLDSYPGGSSAGSGVSVAVGSAFATLGTDTLGSVRTPAAVNLIVGLKPTYGRVSRFGVLPGSQSLDVVGPLARTVEDAAIVLSAIAGYDQRDPASQDVPVPDYRADLALGVEGLRLGVAHDYFFDEHVHAGVARAAEAAISHLVSLGAEIVNVSIPELDWISAVGSTIVIVDYSAWHRRLLREQGSLYAPGTRMMLQLGELLPATAYANALRARRVLCEAVKDAFNRNELTALVGPSLAVTAPTIAHMTQKDGGADLFSFVHLGYPASVTGLPSITVPCGFSDGMPVGLQVIGRPFEEAKVFRIAQAYEATTPWHTRHPSLS